MSSPDPANSRTTPSANVIVRSIAALSRSKRSSFLVVAAFFVLAIFAGHFGSGIKVDTDLKALLPKDAPSVQAIDHARKRKSGSSETLTVAVKSSDDPTNTAMIEHLAEGIRQWPETVSVLTGQEYTPFRDRALDFLSIDELQDLHDRLKQERQKAIANSISDEQVDDASKLIVDENDFDSDFDDDLDWEEDNSKAKGDEPAKVDSNKSEDSFDLKKWQDEQREKIYAREALSKKEVDLIWPKENEAGELIWPKQVLAPYRNNQGDVRVLKATLTKPSTDVSFAQEISRRVEQLQKDFWNHQKQGPPPNMQVGVVGAYNLSGEVDAIMEDLSGATTLSGTLVLAVLLLGFRRPRAIVLVTVPMAVAMSLTLAFARLSFGELNALTAFLFAVLFGMGIDFALHLYSQREEQGPDWNLLLRHHLRPLTSTMATTAGCLLVLAAAEFKAFREFGIISAVGVFICFSCALMLIPALDRLMGPLPPRSAKASSRRANQSVTNSTIGKFRFLLLAPLAVIAALQIPKVDLERDTRNLEANRDQKTSKKKLSGYSSATGRCSKMMTLIAESPEDLNRVVDRFENEKGKALEGAVVEKDEKGPRHWVKGIYSLSASLPKVSDEKNVLKKQIAQQASDFLVELPKLDEETKKKRGHLEALEQLGKASPLLAQDLPDWAREPFLERDGSIDKIAHLCLSIHGYNLDELSAVSHRVNELIGDDAVQAADSRLVFSDLIRLVEHDAKRLPIFALFVIAILLALDLRKFGATLICSSSLGLGLLFTFGVMGGWPLKVNFFNLVVVPAVVGLGIDASIHLWHARQHGEQVGATSKASILASLTTIAGFSGLLIADHPGLKSIGELGVLAITVCVGIAFFVLYPFGGNRSKNLKD